jgi:glycosyltransferase involved in cell wall biosynthesis
MIGVVADALSPPIAPARIVPGPGLLLKSGARSRSFGDGLIKPVTLVPNVAPLVAGTRLALIGGFTPRRCGIATFTADIYHSLTAAAPGLTIDIYAMTPAPGHTQFASEVTGEISESDPDSYAAAAQAIEASKADVIWLQHEFGLFGGPAGDLILDLIDRISAPLLVTLHTVISDPDLAQARVMRRLVARASKLIVMSERSRELLEGVYGADPQQIVCIPHGVPDRPFGRSDQLKEAMGFAGRQLLLTFGLLSPGKGIEAVIRALPALIADHPDLIYCIAGATHPNLIAREGEAYRSGLIALAQNLGVADHLHWIDAFIATDELLDLIEAADIYVTPYPGAAQSTSGTLCYALALGKAVVSTPYEHAVELLSDGHGMLVPFGDSPAIAEAIGVLLDDPARRLALQSRAYARGRAMIWPVTALRSLELIAASCTPTLTARPAGPIGLTGLLRICDQTGILQHSVHSVPDRAHGYCVDDNARALMLANRLGSECEPHRSQLATTFAAFIQSAWNAPVGEFRNFMGYGRNWLEERGSEDSCGRTLWTLGATACEGQTAPLRRWALGLFDQAASSALGYGSPRASAFAMLGANYLLRADPGNRPALAILSRGADRLLSLFQQVRSSDWPWFESVLAYDNCRLSEAMIRAGLRLDRPELTQCGLGTLGWIMVRQTSPTGHFRPVGSDSFDRAFEWPRPFDQQPVEAWAAIDACAAAYDVTGSDEWLDLARMAYGWFGGANDRGLAVGDPLSGTCRDGITPRGLNRNEGAESVLAYQLATLAMRALPQGSTLPGRG